MSGEKATSPCNKFQANIFNKSKCQNCFKSRELHLLNDHDMDQAKPIYGGWLCLAPEGTDFDNPMQRSRKWQRRFFILYEHGSLTFALDELPSTLPQGTVNLNLCSEVTDAEAKTGQRNALWITTPEQDIYIRGENKEIIHGWCDQLVVYPRTNKQNQKKKRKVCPVSTQEPSPAKMAATNPCFPGVGREAGSSLWQEEQPVRGLDITSVWPVTDSDPSSPDQPPAGNISRYLSPVSREPLASGGSWLCSSISSSVSSLESVTSDPGCDGRPAEPNDVRASTSDENRRAEGSHRDREGSPTGFEPANPGWVEDGVVSRKGRSEVRASTREKLQSCGDMQQLSSPAPPPQRRAKSLDRRTSESIMTPDLLNFKKGWMVKSDKEGQWKKFWFVLSADSLRYFKDSIAEEASDLEGEIDLTKCYNVSEYQVQRNYGFQVHTQRGIYTLSAMTTGIRRNWIQALMKNVHPSHAPDVASLPGHHIPSSPSEVLPKPDVTQESPSKVPTETDRRPKPRSVLERRREGRYRTFDWAEFRPLAKPPTEAETRRGAKDPCGQLESIDRERKKRREERRRRYESMLGLPLAWELLGDCRTREDSDRASSPRSQQRAQEEMEQCWQLVENTAFRLEKTVPLHPEAPTEDTVELEGLLDNYRKRVEDLKAELAESDRLRLELEAQLNTAGCHQTQVPTLLDPPLSPESDFGPLTSHETSHEMSLSSHTQSLRDMYRETKALLHQQDLIRQDMQEQLGLVLSIPAPLQDHNSPGGQTPSIWLHDADGNIQDLGDLLPESCVPVDTPLLSPISDGQCSPPQSEASDSDSGATDPQTDLDGDVRQRAHSPETQTLISIEWSPDSLAMDETGGESAGDSEGDGLNRCEPLSCAEGHMAQDQAVVRRLSQEVVLLASQNEALNQRNQEMLNQLTEADREIERLKAELVSSSRHAGDPHHLSEADQLNQTRAECLERELSKRNQQLQEAQSLIASLEERLRDTETQLQLRQATLQGLGVPAGTEEEGDENTDALLYEKKAEGYLLRCFEATEAKLTELERQLRQSERTCGELLANNMEFREIERLYSQRATEAEADIRRLNAELENERLGEGDKLIVGNTVSVDERVQQVIEGMVMMLHALGKLLQVVDRSDYRMIKGSIESGHEEEKQAKTVVSQLKWEEEFWEVMLTGLKGDPSLLSKEKRMDTLLSEVAERMVAEKQMLLLAHDLFSETDSCRDSGRGGREGMCESGSLKDLDIIGNIASDSEPEDTENDDNDDNRWILDSNQQHGNTDKNISRHFTELTQTKISLLNHIASSVRASANENLRSMAHRLCDFHSSEHPWSDFIHSAAIEALYSYHISRLHSSYRRELEETKQRLLASSLICSDCAGLRGENIELRTRLSDLEERWNALAEAEISTLSQMEATDAELWDGGTDDQRVDNTAGSVTGEMEEENPGHESTAEEEDVQNVETPEKMLEDYAMPDHMEMPLLSDEGHRAIREKMAADDIEIIYEDREETYSVGLEDIVLLRDRVKDLEGQLSALVDEMKVELEGTITSLQLQHEKDIEKLKGAYEQGFITMEDSHQRAVEELQHRQQRELERLLEDRDSLLEEETAATITAIAAIKNAHRLELQREVQKRCQSNNSTGSADLEEICRQHSEELASCQRELEAVSEQYSLKCLENGHFSQALDTDRKALCQCQQENQDLRTRNQELSGDLAAEVTRLCSLAQQDALPLSQGMDVYELEITLRVKESEVQCLKQELASLKDELQSAQRDKRLVGKKYKDIYAELTTMRAKADRDVGQLEENLRLAHQALGETSP